MPSPSWERPAGALRYARAPRPGLLATTNPEAQINRGFYPSPDERWGSRQVHHQMPGLNILAKRFHRLKALDDGQEFFDVPRFYIPCRYIKANPSFA